MLTGQLRIYDRTYFFDGTHFQIITTTDVSSVVKLNILVYQKQLAATVEGDCCQVAAAKNLLLLLVRGSVLTRKSIQQGKRREKGKNKHIFIVLSKINQKTHNFSLFFTHFSFYLSCENSS